MTTHQFLDLLHGPDARIYFSAAGKTWKNKPKTFTEAEKTLRWRNQEGDDICFIVNTGGTRDAQITKINAVFIDWDGGKDDQGRYFDEATVREKKAFWLPKLKAFRLQPSILVETRNGFHAYWLVDEGVTPDLFRSTQERLALYFGADAAVSNPARLMRLTHPGNGWSGLVSA